MIPPHNKHLMRNRDYHKKRAIKYASQNHWESFKKLRNKVNIQMRNMPNQNFSMIRLTTQCSRSNDPKKAWTLINTLLGKNNKLLIDKCYTFYRPDYVSMFLTRSFASCGCCVMDPVSDFLPSNGGTGKRTSSQAS